MPCCFSSAVVYKLNRKQSLSTKSKMDKTKRTVHRNADRERNRVRNLRVAFQTLQSCLPAVPPDTKLSKLDILILATNYITQLTNMLVEEQAMIEDETGSWLASEFIHYRKFYHPIKKWPMRSRLYENIGAPEQSLN